MFGVLLHFRAFTSFYPFKFHQFLLFHTRLGERGGVVLNVYNFHVKQKQGLPFGKYTLYIQSRSEK